PGATGCVFTLVFCYLSDLGQQYRPGPYRVQCPPRWGGPFHSAPRSPLFIPARHPLPRGRPFLEAPLAGAHPLVRRLAPHIGGSGGSSPREISVRRSRSALFADRDRLAPYRGHGPPIALPRYLLRPRRSISVRYRVMSVFRR